MSVTINLLFPHQLFPHHALYENGAPIYIVEEHLFFQEFNFHKIKLAYHHASMQAHAEVLRAKGLDVHYISSFEEINDVRKLIPHLAAQGIQHIYCIDPTDNWLEKRINESAEKCSISLKLHENPLFLNTRNDLLPFFSPCKKKFFQTTFYKQQRLKRGILLDEQQQPIGGKWSFDHENRKPYPKKQTPPPVPFVGQHETWDEAIHYVNEYFPNNLGSLTQQALYPFDRQQSLDWLQQFFQQRFYGFGTYEDAIHKDVGLLHHSLLTPMLNVGLLSPEEVIEEALAYANTYDVPINSLEGFVRQIVGWREFIRGMYEAKATASRNSNFWNCHREVPQTFYDGTTGIPPVDTTIKRVRQTAYCHHIERLMVLGNFMLLCEIHPHAVYQWFMELFIDAYDWVMVPNVYGMSQFADGGFFATKPYISGSNYILKMSNYPKGEWQKTWDGLFWRFMDRNRDFFVKNPRLGMLVRTFDKMPMEKQIAHKYHAEAFLAKHFSS